MLTIIAIEGNSPRTVGAQMALNAHGQMQGYLTGGCLEQELAAVALTLLDAGRNEIRRYGRGSPYIDLRLPCGSGIDIYYDQALPDALVFEAEAMIKARRPFSIRTELASGTSTLSFPAHAGEDGRLQQPVRDGVFERLYPPGLRLRIFGAGFSAIQLAFLAGALGLEVDFFTNDAVTVSAAGAMSLTPQPIVASSHAVTESDPWTASVLMFHEHDHEIDILAQLMTQPDFYIGAIGNRMVNHQRAEALRARGFGPSAIERLIMPAGLVRRARSATEIAVGVLAEILDTARARRLVL